MKVEVPFHISKTNREIIYVLKIEKNKYFDQKYDYDPYCATQILYFENINICIDLFLYGRLQTGRIMAW